MSRFRVEVEPSGEVRVFAPPAELDRISEHLGTAGLACRRESKFVAIDASWRDALAALARYDGDPLVGASPAESASPANPTAVGTAAAPVPWLQVFLWAAGFAALIGLGFFMIRFVEELTGNEWVAKWSVVAAAFLGSMIYKLLGWLFRSRTAAARAGESAPEAGLTDPS